MEDRYLFRAKRKDNGEWTEGFLLKRWDGLWIFTIDEKFADLIIPSTLCQCTGRKDKNGKLIYENDIMVAYYDEENPVMVVWRECGLVAVENNSDELCPLDYFTQKHFYVVGNIFDNPELLEV